MAKIDIKPPLVFKVLNRLIKHFPSKSKYWATHVLWKLELKDYDYEPQPFEGWEFKYIDSEDYKLFSSHPERNLETIYKNRLDGGHLCYCSRKGDQIAALQWGSPKSGSHFPGNPQEFKFFPLKDNEIFTYDWYTFKAFRKKGIGGRTKRHFIHTLKQKGYKSVYTLIETHNYPSIHVNLQSGYYPIAMVHFYRIGNFKKCFIDTSHSKEALLSWAKQFHEMANA